VYASESHAENRPYTRVTASGTAMKNPRTRLIAVITTVSHVPRDRAGVISTTKAASAAYAAIPGIDPRAVSTAPAERVVGRSAQ